LGLILVSPVLLAAESVALAEGKTGDDYVSPRNDFRLNEDMRVLYLAQERLLEFD
jgi:hypothetical protein